MIDKTIVLGGNSGLAIGYASALMLAARRARSQPPRVLTVEETAEKKARDERAKWNAEVEARKAEKRSRKALR